MRFHVDIVDLCEALTDLTTTPDTVPAYRRAHTVATELWGALITRRATTVEN